MRLGILGSLVWDRIEHPAGPPIERWGGIAYSLAAAAAAVPDDWMLRPIIRVGHDLSAQADAFLETLPRLERPGGVVEAPEPNNRVHLRYQDAHRRHECLTGGVGPWDWSELQPHLDGLDGLFVNLISGFELELETVEQIRSAFDRPLYADLHSLLLGTGDGGPRTPRVLPDRDRWLAAFDVIQVNEDELALVAGDENPWSMAEAAVARGLDAMLVTQGPGGATVVAATRRPWEERGSSAVPERRRIGVRPPPAGSDPTGCGDVWGATCFVALMRGDSLDAAVHAANQAAGRNLAHRGADGLYHHLKERA